MLHLLGVLSATEFEGATNPPRGRVVMACGFATERRHALREFVCSRSARVLAQVILADSTPRYIMVALRRRRRRGASDVAHMLAVRQLCGPTLQCADRHCAWRLAQGASKGASPPIQAGGGHTRAGGGHAKAAARSSGEGVVSLQSTGGSQSLCYCSQSESMGE